MRYAVFCSVSSSSDFMISEWFRYSRWLFEYEEIKEFAVKLSETDSDYVKWQVRSEDNEIVFSAEE